MRDTTPDTPQRVLSVDAFRGFVMLLMMAEVLELWRMAEQFSPGDPAREFWDLIKFHTTHVEWGGCSLHDLIQPAFTFLVGVSLPFSIAQREAKGQSFLWMIIHAVWRSLLLIAIGIFLRSVGRPQTNWMFTDTLGQIGLGYTILFLIGYVASRSESAVAWLLPWASLITVLVGYWALFAFYPLPPDDFDYASIGITKEWRDQHSYNGQLAHWNKDTNPAMDFDLWFLNQFPRPSEFRPNGGGGYVTLSFIPTLGTMILGLLAGTWLRLEWPDWAKLLLFTCIGLAGLGIGAALEDFGICPVVKRIWTPAWTIYSGGWCFLLLAVFYLVVDIIGFWHWAFPLFVLGANSIVAYCTNGLFRRFLKDTWKTHLGVDAFRYFDTEQVSWERPLLGLAVLLTLFLMLLWMYRSKIFVRI